MTTPDCPRTTLVEALRDGRLGPQESASMERHLEGCAICSELARDLAKIGAAINAPKEKLTPLEHQRERVALLQRAATQSPARTASNGPRYAFGAVLMAAAVVLGFLGGRWDGPTNQVAIALHLGALPTMATNTKLGLHASENARFTRNRNAELDELVLDDGTIDVKLQKLDEGKKFVVRTKDAQISVRATAFRVEAENGHIRSVAVEQGTLEVQYAGFTAVIPAGGSWRATPEAGASDKPTPRAETEANPAPTTTTPPPGRLDIPVATNIRVPRTAKRDVVAIEMHRPDKLESASLAPEKHEPSPIAENPAPKPTTPPVTPASRTFAAAMAALQHGDYSGSAEKLSGFAETYSGDARADEAAYMRAIVLQRAGRKDEAAAAAKQYLTRWPNGAHRADASRIAGR